MVDENLRLSRSVYCGNKAQLMRKQAGGVENLIALNRNDVVSSMGRIVQSFLPIGMVALPQHTAEMDTGALDRTWIPATEHHESCIIRKPAELRS